MVAGNAINKYGYAEDAYGITPIDAMGEYHVQSHIDHMQEILQALKK